MSLPDALVMTLQRWDRRRRRLLLLRGLSEAVIVTIGVATTAVFVDHLMTPGPVQRWAMSVAVWGSGAGVLLWRGVVPALRSWSLLRIARHAEHLQGGLEERLSSAVALTTHPAPGISPWMVARTVAMAAQTADGISATRLLPLRRLRRQFVCAGVASGVLLVLLLVPATGPWFMRAFGPGLTLGRPSGYVIMVQPGDVRVARGAALAINVQVEPTPDVVQAIITWEDGLVERLALSGSDADFVLDLPAVTRSFRYRIRADAGESPEAAVTVVEPPVLADLQVAVTPPAYTGLPMRISTGGDADMVAGSRVSITARADADHVQGLVLLREGHDDLAMTPNGDGQWQAQFLPETSQAFRLRLVGRDGIIVEPATRWLLTVRPDAAPVVRAELVESLGELQSASLLTTMAGTGAGAGLVARHEQVLLRVQAADDHGLRSLRLVVADDQREVLQRDLLAGRSGAPRAVDRIESIAIAELDVVEGDRLSIHLEAVDQGGVRSTSPAITLDVVGAAGAEAAQLAAQLRHPLRMMESALVDLRAAERGWAGLLRTFRPEDPAAQRGELLLLGSRSHHLSRDLADIVGDLTTVATTTDQSAATRILGIAERLHAWVTLHETMIASAVRQAIAGEAGHAERQRGRDLIDAAYRTLDPLRSDVLLVIARLEAEALAAATAAAERQARHAALVIQGMESWTTSRWTEGLAMVMRKGTIGEGRVLRRAVTVPQMDAAILAKRNENFSLEWTGELRVPTDGSYVFVLDVDDGARIHIEDRSILSPDAWRAQGSTTYTGTVELTAGWVPIEIAYFQDGGDAAFTLAWGPVGVPVQPLALADLRQRPAGPSDRDLVRAMIAASPVAGQHARDLMQRALATGVTVDGILERLASETGRERLQHLAREAAVAAHQLRALAEPAVVSDAAAVVSGVERVAQLAGLARDHLADAVDHEREAGSPLAVIRAMVGEFRARVDVLRRIRENLPTADREATVRRELTAMQAIAQTLTDRLHKTRGEQLMRVQRPGATPVERSLVLAARESLATSTAQALVALHHALQRVKADPDHAVSTLEPATAAVADALAEAERLLIQADDERFAARADAATTQLASAPAAAAASTMAAMAKDLRTLAVALRHRGRMTAAQRLETAASSDDRTVQRQALAAVATRPDETVDLISLALRALERSEQAVLAVEADEDASGGLDAVREDLLATSLVLRLAVQTGGSDRQRHAGLAIIADEAETMAHMIRPNATVVAELRQRLQQILDAESAVAGPVEPLVDMAAQVAAAITQPERRAAVAAELPAPAPSATADLSTVRATLVTQLDAAGADERRWAQEEQRAREDFAAAELQTADALTAATARLDSTEAALSHRLLGSAGEARRRSELARASSALPGAESAQLAAAAYRSALAIEEHVVVPLAKRALDDAAVDRAALADIGLTVSDAVRLQKDAAQRLQHVLVHRAAARVALARHLVAAEHILAATSGSHLSPEETPESMANATARADRERAVLTALANSRQQPAATIATHEQILAETGREFDGSDDAATIATVAAILQAVGTSARTLASEQRTEDSGTATQAAAQAAVAHQTLMRATASVVSQALSTVATLRAAPGTDAVLHAIPDEEDPADLALRQASAAVQAAPADDAAWRHAADVLAGAVGDRMLAPTVAGFAEIEKSAEDPFAVAPERPVGDDQADWLRSAGPLYSAVSTPGFERFSAEYQAAIRAYFRRIAQEHRP